jgi:hypothetical protein
MKRIDYILRQIAGHSLKAVAPVVLLGGAFALSQTALAQQVQWPSAQLHELHSVSPWAGGTNENAPATQAPPPGMVQGLTIPMSTFKHVASKDGISYTSTIVGTNPFDPTTWSNGAPINAVVVPVVFTMTGASPFDPTIGDPCDNNVSALARFKSSPLTNPVNLTVFNQFIGNTQFINGFRRAEFWNTIQGSSAYQNPINFTYLPAVTINGAPISTMHGTNSSGCPTTLGILPPGLQPLLEGQVIPGLQGRGNISPNQFVIFLFHNVVQQEGPGYILGYHAATGSPVQTYAVVDWETTSFFGPGVADASVASHEMAEWMDDPLGTNLAPAWGNVGQVSGCSTLWESGDPLTGYLMPPITVSADPSKYPYHMQELAFFSFYFNSPTDPSLGASYYIYKEGTFSMNGSWPSGAFLSPANVCPSGGLAAFGGKW